MVVRSLSISKMGILSCPSDPTNAAAAAADLAAENATGVSTSAETANTSVPSGSMELEHAEAFPHHDASDEDQLAPPTWGACDSEKQHMLDAKNDGIPACGDQSAPGNDEQRFTQQEEVDTCLKKEGSAECTTCGEDLSKVGNSQKGRAGICEACSGKIQTSSVPNEMHGEEPFEPHSQVEASSVATAVEDTGATSNRHQGQAEVADEAEKSPAASRNSSSSNGSSGSSTSSTRGRSASGAGSTAGSAATAGATATGAASGAATAAAAPRKCIDEGSARRHVVPVGPRHQVPCLPPFFLENGGFGCCCGEPSPALDPSLTAKLVYSPSSLERVRQRRLAEGLADRAICTEGDMEAFMQQCAKNWKGNKPGWQPFSPEFAFKLLHYAGYDPAKALQLMEDPQFSFQLVCDGPVRRYDNKWRPKDRRGVISPTPYPPPVFLRGYLSRRHYRESTGYSLR